MWGAGCFTARNGDKYPQIWDQGLPAMAFDLVKTLDVAQKRDAEEGLVFVEEVIYVYLHICTHVCMRRRLYTCMYTHAHMYA
jgi:hypothetical protein